LGQERKNDRPVLTVCYVISTNEWIKQHVDGLVKVFVVDQPKSLLVRSVTLNFDFTIILNVQN